MRLSVLCNTVCNAIFFHSSTTSHISFVNPEGTQGASHVQFINSWNTVGIQPGCIDCSYNMYSTARDPSSSDIFSLRDRQPVSLSSWCNSERGNERLDFTDSEYVAWYIQKYSIFSALLSECCHHWCHLPNTFNAPVVSSINTTVLSFFHSNFLTSPNYIG